MCCLGLSALWCVECAVVCDVITSTKTLSGILPKLRTGQNMTKQGTTKAWICQDKQARKSNPRVWVVNQGGLSKKMGEFWVPPFFVWFHTSYCVAIRTKTRTRTRRQQIVSLWGNLTRNLPSICPIFFLLSTWKVVFESHLQYNVEERAG